jgi:hypothetical protein
MVRKKYRKYLSRLRGIVIQRVKRRAEIQKCSWENEAFVSRQPPAEATSHTTSLASTQSTFLGTDQCVFSSFAASHSLPNIHTVSAAHTMILQKTGLEEFAECWGCSR